MNVANQPLEVKRLGEIKGRYPRALSWFLVYLGPVLFSVTLGALLTYFLLSFAPGKESAPNQLTDACNERMTKEFSKLPQVVNQVCEEWRSKKLDLKTKRGKIYAFLVEKLAANKSIAFISIGTKDGLYFSADRVTEAGEDITILFCDPVDEKQGGTDGKLRIYPKPVKDEWHSGLTYLHQYKETYRPFERPWFLAAAKTQHGVWTEPYFYVTKRDSGINYSQSVHDNRGEFLGVVTTSFTFRQLGMALMSSLNDHERQEAGAAFLLREREGKQYLLASSDAEQFPPDVSPSDSTNQLVRVAWDNVRAKGTNTPVSFEFQKDNYIALMQTTPLDPLGDSADTIRLVTCLRLRFSPTDLVSWIATAWAVAAILGLIVGVGLSTIQSARLARYKVQMRSQVVELECDKAKLQTEITKRESLIKLIHDTVPAILFVKDRDGRYLYANNKCAQDVGCSSDVMIGATDEAFFDPESWDAIKTIDADLMIHKRQRFFQGERSLTTKNGRTYQYRLSKLPWIFNDDCVGEVGWADETRSQLESELASASP